jgi:hypothetical protein
MREYAKGGTIRVLLWTQAAVLVAKLAVTQHGSFFSARNDARQDAAARGR